MQVARWLVGFVCLLGVGGFFADFVIWETAKQHMKNPAWTQHAKFHNAQTMLMGIGLGFLGGVVLFAFRPLTVTGFLIASGAASLYWISMILAPLFPGTDWSDPEFKTSTPRVLGLHPQQLLAYTVIGILVLALLLFEMFR